MKKKLTFSVLLLCLSFYSVLFAQTKVSRIDEIMDAPIPKSGMKMDSIMSPKAKTWMSENSLDSLDYEKMPKIVTMGLMLNGNMGNFLITRKAGSQLKTTSSYLRAGVEVGGFMDFLVTRHFAIQAQLMFTAEQNHFGMQDSTNHLWSFGADIPVLFLYRLGNLQKGYFNVGAGIYAHFTFASNKGIYRNTESDIQPSETPPFYVTLHDNHAGVVAQIGYEFPIGIQLNFRYMVSLSDMFGYYKSTKGTLEGDCAFYPQRLALGIAYRWKK
ncbi:MAG: PorT family protein [Paludibacteraceae bacterium]|nr:PorT family protein [Paludibacteraceae bacterium]